MLIPICLSKQLIFCVNELGPIICMTQSSHYMPSTVGFFISVTGHSMCVIKLINIYSVREIAHCYQIRLSLMCKDVLKNYQPQKVLVLIIITFVLEEL